LYKNLYKEPLIFKNLTNNYIVKGKIEIMKSGHKKRIFFFYI